MMHMRHFRPLLAAAGLWVLLAAPGLAQQRVALVIGNASYAHAPRLANSLNDAADVGAALARLGFAVTKLENANYAALRQGLLAFTRAASAAEVAVVFYAGHGIEVDQRNFLVPVDARLASDQDVEFETVPLALVMRSVGRASGLRLVILDACRDNPFAASMQRSGATRAIGRGLARVEPAGETLVAYAAKEGTVASDGDGRNSPYSQALLAHLEEPGLEVGLLFRKVRDAVLASTGGRQEPFVYGSLSSRGVYLTARAAAVPRPSAPVPPAGGGPASERLTAEALAAERVFWESVKDSTNSADLQAYLDRYPGGTYEVLARNRLQVLREAVAPATPAVTAASVEAGLGLSRSDRRLIQLGLSAAGFDPGPADGLFGRGTRGAIRQWQASRGESVTGYLDAETAKSLLASGEAREAREQAAARQAAAEGERLRREQEARERAQREAEERARRAAAEAERQRLVAERHSLEEQRRLAEERRQLEEQQRQAEERARREVAAAERRRREKEPGRRFRDCTGCPEMVVVPSGSFMMGSPPSEKGRFDNEGPQHRVTIAEPFAVGVHEVTRGEFARFVRATGHSAGNSCRTWDNDAGESVNKSGLNWRNPGFSQTDAHPVVCVSWDDAQAYARWLSRETGERYRLLSESEWEYVARAGTRTARYWGASESGQCRHANGADMTAKRHGLDLTPLASDWRVASCDDGYYRTSPAGSFRANGFGLHDVSGNVWEWAQDCWNASYQGAPGNGRAWDRGECGWQVVRGGSWYHGPRGLRSAIRGRNDTGSRNHNLGFRLVRTFTP